MRKFFSNLICYYFQDASTTDEGLLEFHFLHHMHNRSSEYFQYLNVEKIHDDVMELMNKVRRFAINDQNSLVGYKSFFACF